MQPLIQHLQQAGKFTVQQLDQIQSRLIIKTFEKGEFFSEPGRPANELAFVLKGILRIFSYSPEGQENTHYFIDENNFAPAGEETAVGEETATRQEAPAREKAAVVQEAANTGTPGKEYIQAVIKTELALLSPQALQNPLFSPSDWNMLREHIRARALLEKAGQIGPTQAGDATARYRKFMETFPQIAGRVPLSHLASYLGITQQSLSRIRKQLTKKSPPRER
jgi:CRP-like cAMP-binding protein